MTRHARTTAGAGSPSSTSHRGSRWSVVAAFTVVAAANQLVWLTYAPVTTVTAGHFGVSEAAVGWLANMFPLWYVLLAIPAGRLLDRWFKPGLAAGALLTAGGAALRLAGDSYEWALAGQIIVSIGQPLVLNAIPMVARNHLAEKDRAGGIALASAGTFAGMVAAFLLGAALPDAEQLTLLVGLGAGVACAAALALLVALRHPLRTSGSPPGGQRVSVRATLADPFIRRLCLLVFFPFGIFDAIMTFAQPLLEPAGVRADVASVMLLLTVLAGVVSCAFVPVVAARRRRERQILVAGLVVAAMGCLLLAVAPSVPTGFVSLMLIGFVLLPSLPIVLELLGRRAGEAEGTASGLVWLTGNIGGFMIPAAVGLFVHEPTIAFLICGAGALVAVPLLRGLSTPTVVDTPAPQTA
ncbi:MFS transporter [Actinomadura sp. 6N118]|uniref:MFS transporter n=1 Tax=Actinomadura sp. 6N118 TaxID=3375151 RepID=UPI0037A2E84C